MTIREAMQQAYGEYIATVLDLRYDGYQPEYVRGSVVVGGWMQFTSMSTHDTICAHSLEEARDKIEHVYAERRRLAV